jgi:AbrB family looped-hinge helix DNA binding protein
MSVATKPESVYFSVKGQVVIPRRLRKEFEIEEGTRAYVEATSEGILIKPVTRVAIERGFGLLKRKAGDQPLAEEWAEHKQQEKELEARRGR